MIPQVLVAYNKGLFLPNTTCPLIVSAAIDTVFIRNIVVHLGKGTESIKVSAVTDTLVLLTLH